MESKTLHEVCLALNISRRVVQGYEKADLIKTTQRNKYGHLLYEEETYLRIEKIRFFQKLGFQIKEISTIIDAPHEDICLALEKQIIILQQKKEEIEKLIQKANELIHQE